MSFSIMRLRYGLFKFTKFPYPKNFYSNSTKSLMKTQKGVASKRVLFSTSLCSMITLSLLYNNVSNCAASSDDDNNGYNSLPSDDFFSKIIDQYTPELQQVSLGSVMGFFTGVAARKISDMAAILIGLSFISLQSLQYLGYININYKQVNDAVINTMDVDGDGTITKEDFKIIYNKFKSIILFNLPSAGGFSAGFTFGLFYGH